MPTEDSVDIFLDSPFLTPSLSSSFDHVPVELLAQMVPLSELEKKISNRIRKKKCFPNELEKNFSN